MCENVFKNEEKRQRRETFTRLFASLAVSVAQRAVKQPQKGTKQTTW